MQSATRRLLAPATILGQYWTLMRAATSGTTGHVLIVGLLATIMRICCGAISTVAPTANETSKVTTIRADPGETIAPGIRNVGRSARWTLNLYLQTCPSYSLTIRETSSA